MYILHYVIIFCNSVAQVGKIYKWLGLDTFTEILKQLRATEKNMLPFNGFYFILLDSSTNWCNLTPA